MKIQDKVVVVTGGASGIGFGMATAFARAGMKLALADIEEGAVTKAAESLRAEGADATAFVVDVSGHGVASSLLSVTIGRLLTPQVSSSSLLAQITTVIPEPGTATLLLLGLVGTTLTRGRQRRRATTS